MKMARIGIALGLVAVLAAPAVGLAQPAPKTPAATPAPKTPAATPSPAGPSPLQRWTGEVVAIDTSIGLVCVGFPDGRVIKFRGSAETLKGYKVGDPMEGTFLRSRAEDAVRRVTGEKTPACPLPPPLRMTYTRWMDDTLVVLSTSRDAELRAVDNALKSYWEAKDDAQRAALRPAVKKALDGWKAKVGDWSKSPHNRKGAVEILDLEVSAKAVAGLSPDEAKAWAVVEQHHKEALAELFKDQKLVLKRTTALGAVMAAHETFKAAAKAAEHDLPAEDTQAETQTHDVFAAVLSDAKDELGDVVTSLMKDRAYLKIMGQARGPWGDLVMGWKDAAKAWWTTRKVATAKGAFAPGNPEKAFEAMVKKFDDDLHDEVFEASLGTVFGVGKLVAAPTGVAAVAITAAQALVNVLIELAALADDAKDAAKANALIAQGKLDADLFEASPLLAAYYLANADTSAVIFFARPFGVPGFVRETEEMVKKARPVLDKAKELILSERYEIPGLRHMKGGTVDSTGKKLKVLPTGKVDKARQDVKDALSPDSAGQKPQARTVTPDTATPFMFSRRWVEWTDAARRTRSQELTALDGAVKAWGEGRSDPEELRGAVWVALKSWQAKEPEGTKSDSWGAFAALQKKVAPATGPPYCPLAAADCNGPWSDKARDPSWPPCADAPKFGCRQVVLGRFGDIQRYIGCPGYITLNLADWSAEKNDRFIACAAAGRLGATCNPPVLIASGKTNIPDTTVTNREIGQLTSCGCTMTVNKDTPGFALACPNGLHGPVACPLVPRSCAGPWETQQRPAHYPKCADPPWNGGKQVVLGTDDDLKPYVGCPGYITLNLVPSDWTQAKNDQFIACAAADKLGATANPPILIASGWDKINSDPFTFRALAQLRMCKCTMEVGDHGAGRVDRCPAPVSASIPGLSRLLPWRACGGPPAPPSGWELLVDLVRRGPAVLAGRAR